jgi:hypothetical protein
VNTETPKEEIGKEPGKITENGLTGAHLKCPRLFDSKGGRENLFAGT